jgi:hypothetical protein
MTSSLKKPKKPRGVVAQFVQGWSIEDCILAKFGQECPEDREHVEAILRRALKNAGVTGKHEHVHITDEEGCVYDCKCGKRYGRALRARAKKGRKG